MSRILLDTNTLLFTLLEPHRLPAEIAKIVKNATLKIYPCGPHGLAQTQQEEFNADLLAFIES